MAQSPLHVGGLASEADVDLTLARDGLDRFVVPGTSLAGAFRSWMKPAVGVGIDDSALTQWVWGEQEHASHLSIEDGLIFPTLDSAIRAVDATRHLRDPLMDPVASRRVEVRTGVGISRESGTAAPGILYTRAVLGAGIAVRFAATLEVPQRADGTAFRAYFKCLVDALANGDILLGAVKSAGLGRVQLDANSATVERVDMSSREGVLSRLEGSTPTVPLGDFDWATDDVMFALPARARVEVPWVQLLPIMVKDAIEGIAIDSLPLTTEMAGADGTLVRRSVIPGTSIKGALRAHAERIVRTLFAIPDLPADTHPSRQFVDALDQLRIVTALFGRAGQGADVAADGRDHHGRGAITVNDVVGTGQLCNEAWRALLTGEGPDAPPDPTMRVSLALRETLQRDGFYPRTRNAIDRWTSGTLDGALFSVLEPRGVTWEPLVIEIDAQRLAPDELGPALALLCYVVRDFCAGMIPLGHSTTAGMGSVSADEARVTIRNLPALEPGGDGGAVLEDITFDRLRASKWAIRASDALNEWREGETAVTAVGGDK